MRSGVTAEERESILSRDAVPQVFELVRSVEVSFFSEDVDHFAVNSQSVR